MCNLYIVLLEDIEDEEQQEPVRLSHHSKKKHSRSKSKKSRKHKKTHIHVSD